MTITEMINKRIVSNKVSKVENEVCQGCCQNYEGECRAYCLPHSKKEEDYRKEGIVKC